MRIVPRRTRTKKQQAGDAIAAGVKAWSELKVAQTAARGAKKGARGAAKSTKVAAKGASTAKGSVTKVRVIALLAAAGGAAFAARKAKGDSTPEPPQTYSPPVGAPKPEVDEPKPSPLSSATPGAPMPPVTPATTTVERSNGSS